MKKKKVKKFYGVYRNDKLWDGPFTKKMALKTAQLRRRQIEKRPVFKVKELSPWERREYNVP